MYDATTHQPVTHNEHHENQATAAPSNTQPSSTSHKTGSVGNVTTDDPHHNPHLTAADNIIHEEQPTNGSTAGRHLSGNGHSIHVDEQQHHTKLATAADTSASSGMQPPGVAMHTAFSGFDQDASLDLSQKAATHHMPAGLASRLSHVGHAHAGSTKPGSIAKQEIAGRQLSEEELRMLFTT